MATRKCTMLFEQSSNAGGASNETRTGGWSESFYSQADPFATVQNGFRTLCTFRARLLPSSARIVGQRYQSIDPPSVAGTTGEVYPGLAGSNDVPQMALFLRVPAASVPNVRPLTLRGLPDGQVTDGEYVPTSAYVAFLARYLQELAFWRFKSKDREQAKIGLESIATTGVFTLQSPLTFAVGDRLNVARARNTRGETLEGTFRVLEVTSTTVGKFALWGDNGAWTGGYVQPDEIIYPLMSDISGNPGAKAVVRKVGRPLSGYRGRSTRRTVS